jgi:hypothetical protein
METVAIHGGGARMSTSANPVTNTLMNPVISTATTIQEAVRAAMSPEPAASDFITTYADFADVFEMPRQIHEWVAAQLIASALNGRVFIKWGAATYPLDLWVLLLSGSGQGRNTATEVALEVIEQAKIDGLLHKATWGSRPAFYQQVAQTGRGLYVWPELSVALRTLNDPKFAGVKEWITDRYDNLRVPDEITYRKTGKKSDTPSIVFDQPPRTNILATSSSDWFINNLEQADTLGGFIPRWLPKQVGKSDRVIPKPVAPNPDLLPLLAAQMASIAKLEGTADLSGIEKQYTAWYGEAKARFASQPNSALADPFFNRLRVELLKLALIFEASQSGGLQVGDGAFRRAVAVASDAEETIFKLLPSGMTREGSEVEKMAEKIRSAGAEGITQSELTRAFQHCKSRERDDRVRTLVDAGQIHRVQRSTGGRSETRYIHTDFRKEDQEPSHG